MMKSVCSGKRILLLALFLLAPAASAWSQQTTESTCPFSCALFAPNDRSCRDWKEGNQCFVQSRVTRNRARESALVTGRQGAGPLNIVAAPCPLSCREIVPNDTTCRDWRVGTTCFVQTRSEVRRGGASAARQRRPEPGRAAARGEREQRLMIRTCPFSCRTVAPEDPSCADWVDGNTCFVMTSLQPQTAEAVVVGNVVEGPCPLSCELLFPDDRNCSDWAEGDRCFVRPSR